MCWGPCRLKKLAGRGSSSVSVYTCLIPASFKAATSAGLLGVADAANLQQAFAHPWRWYLVRQECLLDSRGLLVSPARAALVMLYMLNAYVSTACWPIEITNVYRAQVKRF